MATQDTRQFQTTNTSRQDWESLADELRATDNVERMRKLVMLLEEAIFNRQQDLASNAGKIDQREVNDEEQALRKVLDLMLETKVKKLGFPDIR